MSLTDLQQMGNQSGPYGGVALGHAPQQPNMGLGPNRYIPPTFNYGSNGQGSRPNYTQMDWNQMQASYLPRTTNQGETANTYMQQLQQMLGGFSQQYGSPNRQPQMPNFGSYNPGFGGATSYYDQQRYNGSGGRYTTDMGMPGGEAGNQNFYPDFGNTMRGGQGGGMDTNRDARIGPDGRVYGRNSNNEFGPEGGDINYDLSQGEAEMGRWGAGRQPQMYNSYRERMGQMPQFNPYVLMQNGLRGMDFNEMFDPRFAALFGGNRFGSCTPNGPKPQSQLINGEYASGGKPGGI